jgi:hypothetical protein
MRRSLLPLAVVVAVLAAGCSADPAGPAAPAGSAGSSAPARSAPTSGATSSSPPAARSGPMVEVAASGARTVVRMLDPGTGRQLGSVGLEGRWSLPTVVGGGQPDGGQPDGGQPDGVTAAGAVVLAGAADGARSRFAVLTPPYTAPALVDLPGGFGYDAISPDGGRLYLVQHLPPAGSEHYQVRAYDVARRYLDPAVVVDKTHLDEWMAGHPVSRTVSADGATVATLYRRAGEAPFIHVLNTVDGFALCLDLPAAATGKDLVLTGVDGAALTAADRAGVVRYRADLTTGKVQDLTAACLERITRAALPVWARGGFSDDGAGLPHVLGEQGRILAALFEYPMQAAADPGVQNKILWVVAPGPSGASTGQPSGASAGGAAPGFTVDGELLGTGTRITRSFQAPGPSGVNFPRAGCWSLTLHWAGLTDTMLLPVG